MEGWSLSLGENGDREVGREVVSVYGENV